jgi:transcriptional regulator with XRE-family HTH domain
MKEALAASGLTQTDVASALGVPRQRIYAWLTGREKVPRRYADPLAIVLDIPVADVPVSTAPHAGLRMVGDPATFLEWMLRQDVISGHLGKWDERIDAVANGLGATISATCEYLQGNRRVPAPNIISLFGRLWPGINPVVMAVAGEAGLPVSEHKAVSYVLSDMATGALFEYWAETVDYITSARIEWETDPTEECSTLEGGLDNGSDPGPWLTTKAEEFGAQHG